MLEPDYIGEAGDLVGSVYSEIELEMLQYLANLLLDQDIDELGQRGLTAVYLLAQTHAPDLMGIIDGHKSEASEAVTKTVEDALSKADKADVSGLGSAVAAAAATSLPRQVELTVQGIQAILDRDNVDMANGALNLWNRVVAQAVTKVNTGVSTTERALHEAVRAMMQEGISTITYRNSETGQQTVTNNIDVAVRRHVRTQILQDGMRRTLDICRDSGIDFVEVSSHGGARPSHAIWQGQVYSLRGDVEVDGVRYKDFYRETDYGSVTGLGGANCRHSFGPWIPGTPRSYEQDPEHPSGLPNDEVYEMSQEQRRREREIRKTKRELAGAQIVSDRDGSMQNIAEVERLKRKLSNQQKAMRDYISTCNNKGKADILQRSARREWAGDMPRIRKSEAANRTIKDFMDSKGVKNALEKNGVSKTAAHKALTAELKARDIDSHNFAMLSRTNQQSIFKDALLKSKKKGKTSSKFDIDSVSSKEEVKEQIKKRGWFYEYDMNGKHIHTVDDSVYDNLDIDSVKAIYRASERLFDTWPELKGKLISISSNTHQDKFTYAETSMGFGRGGVFLNTNWFNDYKRAKKAYEKDVADGWHPQGTTIDGLILHELGHAIDDYLTNTLGKGGKTKRGKTKYYSAYVQERVLRKLKVKKSAIKDEVSEYAFEKGSFEFFAECIAEYLESDSPRRMAQEVGKMIDTYFS